MRLNSKTAFYLLPLLVLLVFILAIIVLKPSGVSDTTCANLVYHDEASLSFKDTIQYDEFGFPLGAFRVEHDRVRPRQTLSHIFAAFDFSPQEINTVAGKMQDVFNPRRIRRGNNYFGYFENDSTNALRYFVYEISDLDFVVVEFGDSIMADRGQKEVRTREKLAAGIIHSSLWNTMMQHGLHPELVMHMSRVLAWSVDFYRIEAGDRFKVLYVEDYVGDRSVGVSGIDAVYFVHRGREIEAFRFDSDTISGYYDAEGNNVRRTFLRAPIEFGGRISSRYSHSRLHPIHGDRRPHLGTDYAAPHGTPILAVGDGVVTRASYTRGNGNYVRIRHNAVYETQYLHMSRFASGIRRGTRVSQGDVIGYVGSTGLATGPHVCFRFWKNGRQVDHLRLEFPSGDPLPDEYIEEFKQQRDRKKDILDNISFDENITQL